MLENVIKKMPQLADVTQTLSNIYQEKGDLNRSLMFAHLSALEAKKDSHKWHLCSQIALKIEGKTDKAIYYYNRAVKALHPVKDIYRIMEIKLEKLQTIYLPKSMRISI